MPLFCEFGVFFTDSPIQRVRFDLWGAREFG